MRKTTDKTALVLSGGGSRGAYEIGVWKALRDLDVKIDMVMGTSVGAINGAMIVQGDPDQAEKLWLRLETDMVFDVETGGEPAEDALAYAKEIFIRGGADTTGLQSLLQQYIDENRIRASSIDYGLVTTEFPSMEGHFLYAEDIPEGRLHDYILASASCFPAVRKYVIDGKRFIDGGYRDNLPVEMAMQRGASRIIAVDLQAAGYVRKGTLEHAREAADEFHLLKSPIDLGSFLFFDRVNASRIMRLGYLETMREWGRYDGTQYTFVKNAFSAHQLAGADNAAYILRLDPSRVYDKGSLKKAAAERCQVLEMKTAQLSIDPLPENWAAFSRYIHEAAEGVRDFFQTAALHGQLLLYIAKELKKNEEKSLFLQPAAFRLLTEEIQAANYLIQEGIV